MSQMLQGEKIIDHPEQLHALRVDDLREIFSLPPNEQKAVVQKRWQEYEYFLCLTPPEILGARNDAAEPVELARGKESLEFKGQGFSGERIIGPARPVQDLFDIGWLDSLSSDDILILLEEHAFFYADWHSIFTMVKGVASRGRPSHHLSQVARECRVSVVGFVEGNLESIKDGAMVELNPAAGRLRVINDKSAGS